MSKFLSTLLLGLFAVVALAGLVQVLLLGLNFASDSIPFLRHKPGPPQNYYYPAFALSPDGGTVVVSAGDEHGRHLFAFDLLTRSITPVTHAPGFQVYPAFAPDGKTLVYGQADSLTAPCHLCLCQKDGTRSRPLTMSGVGTLDEFPAWTPDGKSVVFSRTQIKRMDGINVCAVRVADGHITSLVQTPDNALVRPCVTPDGRRVLFEQMTADNTMALAQADISGAGAASPVVQMEHDSFDPCCFPGTGRVVFTVNDGGGGGSLWTLDRSAPGARPARLHNDDDYSGDTDATVSADGAWVYFLRHGGLWRIGAGGGKAAEVVPTTVFAPVPHV